VEVEFDPRVLIGVGRGIDILPNIVGVLVISVILVCRSASIVIVLCSLGGRCVPLIILTTNDYMQREQNTSASSSSSIGETHFFVNVIVKKFCKLSPVRSNILYLLLLRYPSLFSRNDGVDVIVPLHFGDGNATCRSALGTATDGVGLQRVSIRIPLIFVVLFPSV